MALARLARRGPPQQSRLQRRLWRRQRRRQRQEHRCRGGYGGRGACWAAALLHRRRPTLPTTRPSAARSSRAACHPPPPPPTVIVSDVSAGGSTLPWASPSESARFPPARGPRRADAAEHLRCCNLKLPGNKLQQRFWARPDPGYLGLDQSRASDDPAAEGRLGRSRCICDSDLAADGMS